MKLIVINLFILFSFSAMASFTETTDFKDLSVEKIFTTSPSDDPSAYNVPQGDFDVELSPLLWMVPGPGSEIEGVSLKKSHSNVAIEFFDQRLFLAYRSAPQHFPGKDVSLYVVSTADGKSWDLEWKQNIGRDLFAPQLVAFNNSLHLFYVVGGVSRAKFSPDHVEKITRSAKGFWSDSKVVLTQGEVPFEMKVRNGLLWMTSYSGTHLQLKGGASRINVYFKKSLDAQNFQIENEVKETVSIGGASEAGFEFDDLGNILGVTKNEDGDDSGFGSHLVFAKENLLSYWTMKAEKQGYHSPKVFRHGNDLYVIARRHKGKKPFSWAQNGSYTWRRLLNWSRYLLTPKATTLYKFNKEDLELVQVMDLPGTGDTGEVSIRRVDENTFLLANFTSDLQKKNKKLLTAKLGKTRVYLMALRFKPKLSE